jgi:phosphopantothenoylcysteine decarboxylase/phosphopantothenate--cysteine ligase
MQVEGATFGYDTNQVTLVNRNGSIREYGLKSKAEVARDIAEYILDETRLGKALPSKN